MSKLKIVTSRDIKNNPNILFKKGQETVITSRGKPKAVCIALDEAELENIDILLSSIRQARTKLNLERIRTEFEELLKEKGNPLEDDIETVIDRIFEREYIEQGYDT